ncbi:MAG: agmatine deiminase family protein [Planctomycetota bacterium]
MMQVQMKIQRNNASAERRPTMLTASKAAAAFAMTAALALSGHIFAPTAFAATSSTVTDDDLVTTASPASAESTWNALATSAHGDLQAMLDLVALAPAPPQARITRPAGELWRVLRDAGRFDDLGLTADEGRVLVDAVYRRLGAPKTMMGDTWPVRHDTGISSDVTEEIADDDDAFGAFTGHVAHRVLQPADERGTGDSGVGPANTPDFRGAQEFENLRAVLFRWPYDWSALRNEYAQMVQTVFDGGAQAVIWTNNASQQADAESYLQSQNVPTSHIRWVVESTNSVWIRDYGPNFLYEVGGNRYGVADFHYYNNRPADDDTPLVVASALNIPVMDRQTSNVVFTEGGNLMHDGVGVVTYSTRTYSQNNGVNRSTVDQRILTAFDATKAIIPQDPTLDGTGHVDMFLKIVSEDTVLIAEYAPNQRDYQILENNAALFASETNGRGEPWNVIRIPQPDVYYIFFIFPVVRTYTNGLVVNDQVIVPTYGIASDAEALSTYQQVYPDKTIVPINANQIIESAGAWHCVTMEHPDPTNIDP